MLVLLIFTIIIIIIVVVVITVVVYAFYLFARTERITTKDCRIILSWQLVMQKSVKYT